MIGLGKRKSALTESEAASAEDFDQMLVHGKENERQEEMREERRLTRENIPDQGAEA